MKPFCAFVLAIGACVVASPSVSLLPASEPAKPASSQKTVDKGKVQTAPAVSAPSLDLRGIVVDESGAPVAQASVFVRGTQFDQAVETGADGTFALAVSGKPENLFLIHAKDRTGRRGFIDFFSGSRELVRSSSFRVVLKRPRQLSISVTDKSGMPVQKALVAAFANFAELDRKDTDSSGKALLEVPVGLGLQYVVGLKPDTGLDYVGAKPKSPGDPLSTEKNEEFKFVLSGARTVTIHVVDNRQKPLAGVRVHPEMIMLPKKDWPLNLVGNNLLTTVTDAAGTATFRFVPLECVGDIPFQVDLPGQIALERLVFRDPKVTERTAVMVPLARVTGKVTTADGRPASGAEIDLTGIGYGREAYSAFPRWEKCDEQGNFELRVTPDRYYTFLARREHMVSARQSRSILVGAPVETLEFVLKPATRVHGRVTRGQDKLPVTNESVSLSLYPTDEYQKLSKDQQLPNPKGSRRWIGPQYSQSAKTDSRGQFEFFVGPGSYFVNLNGVWEPRRRPIKVDGQQEIEANLVDTRPERSAVEGRVVLKSDPRKTVAGAKIEGASTVQTHDFGSWFRATADENGEFHANRPKVKMLVFANSGSLAGSAPIESDAKTVVVPIGPTGSVRGTLIDGSTGKPVANRQIDFSVRLPEGGGAYTRHLTQNTTTDANGHFAVKGLTVGLKYTAYAVAERNEEGPQSWNSVGDFVPKDVVQVDLGELKLPAPRPPYTPPTLDQLIAQTMDSKKPFDARLDTALADARLFENFILLFASSAKSDPCRRFISILNARGSVEGADEARQVAGDFMKLTVDTSAREPAAELRTLLARLGLTLPASDDALLAVLDHDGRLVAATTGKALSLDKQTSAKPLAAFLKKHLPPAPDAEKRLADALARAKREKKRVLVEQSAAWCGPCRLLARYLERNRLLIEKDYVWIMLDTRFVHGEDVINKLRAEEGGGIPWMVILDADGKSLINSNAASGNIGFPSEAKEIEHYEKMLRATAQRLSDAEIKKLIADARQK